jgi:hypothetical protein
MITSILKAYASGSLQSSFSSHPCFFFLVFFFLPGKGWCFHPNAVSLKEKKSLRKEKKGKKGRISPGEIWQCLCRLEAAHRPPVEISPAVIKQWHLILLALARGENLVCTCFFPIWFLDTGMPRTYRKGRSSFGRRKRVQAQETAGIMIIWGSLYSACKVEGEF